MRIEIDTRYWLHSAISSIYKVGITTDCDLSMYCIYVYDSTYIVIFYNCNFPTDISIVVLTIFILYFVNIY